MTTITINEKIDIKGKFETFFELYKYINENFDIKIDELENQDNILNSKEYISYNNIFTNINLEGK